MVSKATTKTNPLLCPRCRRPVDRKPRHSKHGAFLGNRITCRCGLVAEEVANDAVWKKVHAARTRRYLKLKKSAIEFKVQLEKAISRIYRSDVEFYLNSVAKTVRLLVFKSLVIKHHVSVHDVAFAMLRVRKMSNVPGPIQAKLYLSLPQLTGPHFLAKVSECLSQMKDVTTADVWKNETQYAQVLSLVSDDLTGSARAAEVVRVRRILQREVKSGFNYRNNPWS